MGKRITIPDNSVALILPHDVASDLFILCQALRNPKRKLAERLATINSTVTATNVLLALVDGDVHV